MKKVAYILLFITTMSFSQVGIGTTSPDASSMLDITSTSGGILIPRMTETDRTNIASPATGLLVYQTDNTTGFWYYTGATWIALDKTPSWDLEGNVGTDATVNFIGTTDDQDIVFKRNNIFSGRINPYNLGIGSLSLQNSVSSAFYSGNTAFGIGTLQTMQYTTYNSAFGYYALNQTTTGEENSAFGYKSMEANTTGQENTVMGANSLTLNNGNGNTVIGFDAMRNATNTRYSTAIGHDCLKDNLSEYMVGIGHRALYQNTTGTFNTAVGTFALRNNLIGNKNTAIGRSALYSNTSDDNTAIGFGALVDNTSGNNNTAVGSESLNNNSTYSDNTAVGSKALRNNNRSNCTAVGSNAMNGSSNEYSTAIGAYSFQTNSYDNSTAIGYNSNPGADNTIRLGNPSVTTIGGYANWSNVSDGRFKINVKEDVFGLDFLLKLRPVIYNLDMDAISKFNKTPDSLRLKDAERLKSSEIQIGFIAQEVEMVSQEIGFNFHGVDKPKNKNSYYGLRYAEFVPPIVKAIQEQQAMISSQKQEIESLKKELTEIKLLLQK